VWQPSENWRTFWLSSIFIVRFDHQNSSQRAAGEGEGLVTLDNSPGGGAVSHLTPPCEGGGAGNGLSMQYFRSSARSSRVRKSIGLPVTLWLVMMKNSQIPWRDKTFQILFCSTNCALL
jgi:hypothetical protein